MLTRTGGNRSEGRLALGISALSFGGLLYAVAAACGATGTAKTEVRSVASAAPVESAVPSSAVSVEPLPRQEVEGTPPSRIGPAMVPVRSGKVVLAGKEQAVAGFWIDPEGVSAGQYRSCVEAKTCAPLGRADKDNARAIVSWKEADAFCRFAGKRLPTEAEWVLSREELRARSSKKTVAHPREFTADRHCSEEIGGCGYARVFRWGVDDKSRSWSGASALNYDIGFRCAWSVTPPADSSPPPLPLIEVKPTSPGRINCETTTCDLKSEVCCVGQDGVGRCKASATTQCEPDNSWSCDENDDCPAGRVCCPIASPARGLYDHICASLPCFEADVCLPGGRCRSGFQCIPSPTGRSGKCEWRNKSAKCGARRCGGDTPICCWDPTTKTGYCAKESCRSGGNEVLYKCSSPRDCGGDSCSKYGYGYGCSGEYAGWLGALCDTVADCPNVPGNSMGYGRVQSCAPNPELPPGVKECTYKSAY